MPHIEISTELWNQIDTLQQQIGFADQDEFLRYCFGTVKSRYILAAGAIVTRNDREVLMVANDYNEGQLVWNLPGGQAELGEDLKATVSRELREETGIEVLEFGPLAWIIQIWGEHGLPFVLGVAYEVARWQGDVSIANEIQGGAVREAKFISYVEAVERMIPGNRKAFRDWLSDTTHGARLYVSSPEGIRQIGDEG
jgi:ADP-ribose pyrophosphatase YjhB (NUDIX family)